MELCVRGLVMVAPLLYFLLSNAIATNNCCGGQRPKAQLCREEERAALLSFKGGVNDAWNRLSSWAAGEECCQWVGVHCHNTSGHVLKLNLGGDVNQPLGGEISNSLLQLKHIRHLDLSHNDFRGIGIPKFFGSLSNLRYLNLSKAGFGGVIPHHLGNLSKLHYLDIGRSDQYSLQVEDVEWISGLGLLEYLDMSYVNLSKASNWLQVINNHLHHLSVLLLSGCELLPPSHDHFPLHVNFSSLLTLDLSGNDYFTTSSSSSFHWFADLTSLTSLNLAWSAIHGQIPSGLRNMSSLTFLDLSNNYFVDSFPSWLLHIPTLEHLDLGSYGFITNHFGGKLPNEHIGNLTSIRYLDLSFNALEGEVPTSLGNLCRSQLSNFSNYRPRKSLEFLKLRGNRLSGSFPGTLEECTILEYLDLGMNRFSGHFPNGIGRLKSLSSLYIDRNLFHGRIPLSLKGLSSLRELNIRENLFEGILSEKHLANLTSLERLDASSNYLLTVQVGSNWTPPFQLQYLDLGSCLIGPPFPAWLQAQKKLNDLNMSNTGISDVVPDWFWTRSYVTVDLSHNQIMGSIPSLHSSYVYLASNNFTGQLPQISSNVDELDLSNNKFHGSLSPMLCFRTNGEENFLSELDVSGNLLYGELPNCWMYWRELVMLNLGNNNLRGEIPSSMSSLIWLSSLHLRHNHLSGEVPVWLKNCSSLIVLDLSENEFTGNIPEWTGNFKGKLIEMYPGSPEIIYARGLTVLVLHSNKFNGSIPLQLCHLESLQILDLGNNNLSGTIPRCFGNFSSMIKPSNSTDFSFNNGHYFGFSTMDTATLLMKGLEYEYQKTLGLLAGIDLSSNNLSGGIPEELTGLHGLIFLNLSRNHLQGEIPVKIGAMTSLESLDLSSNRLSGVIPQGMATISFLSHLNLSYNNLSGKIPSGTQIQGFSPLSFIGNPELCGAPLSTHDCGDQDGKTKASISDNGDREEENAGWMNMKWFYLGMPWGFVVGFWAILGPLAFKRAWRHAYFRFLDEMKYKLLG